MNIFLTGYKGFIGSHMLKRLLKDGHNVTTYEWGESQDLSLNKIDWVVHIGAISSTTETDIEKLMLQNVDFTVDLYERCMQKGINFQFSSSASLYGRKSEFKESSPLDPRNPYAWSKYMCEWYLTRNQSSARTQIFRYFNVYGSGEDHKGDQASPYHKFTKQVKEKNEITLFTGSESYYRDFIPVEEVIDTHVKFFDVQESGVWNVGTGKVKSFLDIAQEVSYNTTKLKYIDMPEQLTSNYQSYTCADMSKMKETLNTCR